MEVAARHRGRASGVQIMKTAELSASECKRDQTTEYHVRPPSLLPRLWPPMPVWLRLRAPALIAASLLRNYPESLASKYVRALRAANKSVSQRVSRQAIKVTPDYATLARIVWSSSSRSWRR